MLFGNDEFKQDFCKKIEEIEKQRDFRTIMVITLGSIAKGLARWDSDYDTKVLYIDDSSFEGVNSSEEIWSEKSKVYRYYPQKETREICGYDKIAFWEVRNFLRILTYDNKEKRGISPELYYQLLYVFTSPYSMDTYGLTNKIFPLISIVLDKNYLLKYYTRYIDKRYHSGSDQISQREYLYIFTALLSMKWLLSFNTYPPIDFKCLLYVCDRNISNTLVHLYSDLITKASSIEKQRGKYERKVSKYILTNYIKELNQYIDKELVFIRNEWSQKKNIFEEEFQNIDSCAVVNQILSAIKDSVNPTKVNGILI